MPGRRIAIVDGNSLLHRAFHALPPTMTAPDGRPTNAVFGFMTMLLKLVADLAPDGVVVAFDKGKPSFRTEALAAYKIQRPPTAPELKEQFPMVKELLSTLGVPVVEVEGWEGDDVLGTLSSMAARRGDEALLVTGDKDALQLIEDGVRVVRTRKGLTDIEVYGPDEVVARFGVPPDRVPDLLGLMGDSSDNIPGVPGIGEKTAAKLLSEHGDLEAVLAAAETLPGKLGENLRAHADAARASKLVATIRRDVPLDAAPLDAEWGAFDPDAAVAALSALAFTSLTDRVLAAAKAGEGIAAPGGVPVSQHADAWRVLSGREALERVSALVADPPQEWIGVASADGGQLFCEECEVAVAVGGIAAVLPAEHAGGWRRLLTNARVAACDLKALLEADDPPGSATRREGSGADGVDPARCFDCGIAAYVLESNRSSYDAGSLAAAYLGRALPDGASAAEVARAAAELASVLERRLQETGSDTVFWRIEMPLVPVLVRMEEAGVGVDTKVLDALAAEAAESIERLRNEICELAGFEFNPDSPKQLAEALFEKLQLPAGKRTKTGYSTDASVLQALAPAYPIAAKVIEYREVAKLKSTYIDALPRLVGADGRLHTTFNQTVAATGRLSSSNPNLQNIPVRSALGQRIRAAFVPARPGDLIVSADYSQIELRVLAHLSGDEGLIEAFASGRDFHAATAARVFGVEPDAVTPEMRRRAKAVNFGIVYGQSAHGLAESLGISRAEAQEMIDRYFAAYPAVRGYLDQLVADAHATGYAVTMFGRRRPIPELKSSNFNLRSFGERTAMNHPMQGTAADIMKLAMIEVDRRLREEGFASTLVLQVHDELVFEAPREEVERLAGMVRVAMTGVVDLAVPLEVSVAWG
ncbi:MAG: DNA polymerase I, partial [Coriobacteriia bacterium]|nr:DNA polymerase I [Coriobacteriia bacterium]